MAPRSNPLSLDSAPVELPRSLRQAIINIMSDRNLDWNPACEAAAVLIDTNSKAFKAQVESKALKLHNSKFLTQLNKVRQSIEVTHYNRGYSEGYNKARSEYEVAFRCNVCNQPITIAPMSEPHQAVVDYMIEHGWGHNECHAMNT